MCRMGCPPSFLVKSLSGLPHLPMSFAASSPCALARALAVAEFCALVSAVSKQAAPKSRIVVTSMRFMFKSPPARVILHQHCLTCRFAVPLCSREYIPLDLRLSFHACTPATALERCQRLQELSASEKY